MILPDTLLAEITAEQIIRIRLGAMLTVLVVSLVSGYLAASRFGVPERYAKTIMTIVLVCFNWLIALLAIWRAQLAVRLVWLGVAAVFLLLSATAISAAIFSLMKIKAAKKLTLIMAGSLNNLSYTGGGFVCYGLFGIQGLAFANMYIILWVPLAYFIFLPMLKIHELKAKGLEVRFKPKHIVDLRFIALPATVIAIILNINHVKVPDFVYDFYITDALMYVASAMAFFAVGLQIRVSNLKDNIHLCLVVSVIKFILTPAVAALFIYVLSLAGVSLPELVKNVIIIMSISPCAVMMVTMSSVFDLDTRLASSLWVATTFVFLVVVLPILILVFA